MRTPLTSRWTKVAVFFVCLVPLGALVWRGFNHGLGANPVEFIQLTTGDWTLRFLVFTLSITPFRKMLNLPDLIRFRRMLGLFAFSYLCIHFLTYLFLDQSLISLPFGKISLSGRSLPWVFWAFCFCCPWRSLRPRAGFAALADGAGKCCIAPYISRRLPE